MFPPVISSFLTVKSIVVNPSEVKSSHKSSWVGSITLGNGFTTKLKDVKAKQPLSISSILTYIVCGFEVFCTGVRIGLLPLCAYKILRW